MAELHNRNRARLLSAALLALLTAVSVSCAYYNTFYLARKYYMRATDGQPYEVDRENTSQRSNYNKSADYSKKVLGVHPNSKWVDDAWLMWARTFIGTDDPLKAVAMLEWMLSSGVRLRGVVQSVMPQLKLEIMTSPAPARVPTSP